VIVPFDPALLRARVLQGAYDDGIRAVAITLHLHGLSVFAGPMRAAAREIARQIGFLQISVSHETSPLIQAGRRG